MKNTRYAKDMKPDNPMVLFTFQEDKLRIESEIIGPVSTEADPFFKNRKVYGYRYRYQMILSNDTNKKVFFEYTGSINDYEKNKKRMKPEDLIYALQSFLSDILIPDENTLSEFLENYGYLESGDQALEGIRIYQLCEKEKREADNLLSSDIYDLINELSDMENNDDMLRNVSIIHY